MKTMNSIVITIALVIGLTSVANAQQPISYGIEVSSGTTHLMLWPLNPSQLSEVPGIIGVPSSPSNPGIEIFIRSDNPQTASFNLVAVYKIGADVMTQDISIINSPDKNTGNSYGLMLMPQRFTLLSMSVTEVAKPSSFQMQH